jgi:hypothetical protein
VSERRPRTVAFAWFDAGERHRPALGDISLTQTSARLARWCCVAPGGSHAVQEVVQPSMASARPDGGTTLAGRAPCVLGRSRLRTQDGGSMLAPFVDRASHAGRCGYGPPTARERCNTASTSAPEPASNAATATAVPLQLSPWSCLGGGSDARWSSSRPCWASLGTRPAAGASERVFSSLYGVYPIGLSFGEVSEPRTSFFSGRVRGSRFFGGMTIYTWRAVFDNLQMAHRRGNSMTIGGSVLNWDKEAQGAGVPRLPCTSAD